MVGIKASRGSKRISIVGHGISVAEPFVLSNGIVLEPAAPAIDLQRAAEGTNHIQEYAAVLAGNEIANFSMSIIVDSGGKELAVMAWNALWNFHLLSLACQTPCCSLYAVTEGEMPSYSIANRNIIVRPFAKVLPATKEQLAWAKHHRDAFEALIEEEKFSAAMRCYGNAHYLFDVDMRIMLLWSGIEGLLSVDAELNRRLALYASLMLDGTPEEKLECYNEVKRAYGIRSKAVHGNISKPDMLNEGYRLASQILVRLLARCVEIGRVPSPTELDAIAVTPVVR